MDERLQQAIAAIKAHDNTKAQQLLAQFLKSNPNHPQGWFLLSQVVADRKQQIAFLNKTLTIDPENRQARQKLIQLGEPLPEPPLTGREETPGLKISEDIRPVSQGYTDFAEQAEATTIPSWLAGQKTYQADEPEQVQAEMIMTEVDEPAAPMPQAEDIPDWLKESPPEEWVEPAIPVEKVEEKPSKPVAATKPASTKPVAKPTKITDKGMEPLPWYFWLLVVLALAVFIALLFQIVA